MELDLIDQNPPRKESHLKEVREAITPQEESWNNDNESDLSALSEQQEILKEEIGSLPQDNPSKEIKQQIGEKDDILERKKQVQLKLFQHYVDHNYLILMIVLRGQNLIDLQKISGLPQGQISLLGKSNKIIVKALDSKSGNEAIQNISNFIDKLNIQKTAIKNQNANRISQSKKLKQYLSKDKITIFCVKTKEGYDLYIGGEMKASELRTHIPKINQIKIQPVFLRALRNKRSYSLIIDEILASQYMQKAMQTFNNVTFAEVEKRNSAKELRLMIGSYAKRDMTPVEYQDFIMKQLRNFYVVTFCLDTDQRYVEKLKCDGVSFLYVKERKFQRSYVYIIALRSDFMKRSSQIAGELEKIGDKIMGVRFFVRIAPEITEFSFDKDRYFLFRFPEARPYSIVLTARRKQGNLFSWKEVFGEIVKLNSEE